MIRTLLLSFFLLSTASCGVNQTFKLAHGTPKTVVIPLDLSEGFPHMMLEINGRTIPVLFDLGGFTTIALSDSILKLTPHTVAGTRSVSDAFGNSYSARNYVLPEVRIAGMTINDVEGTEVKHFVDPVSYMSNGYVGWQLINKFKRAIIDYPASCIVLSNDDEMPEAYRSFKWITSPFKDKGGAVSTVTLNGREAEAWWDTGANWSIVEQTLNVPVNYRSYHGSRQMWSLEVGIAGVDLGRIDFVPLDLSGPAQMR